MKKFKGTLTSSKMAKTAVVEVERWAVHPLYEKRRKVHKKYHVHNDLGANIGDKVEIVETKPISKTKRWKVARVIQK